MAVLLALLPVSSWKTGSGFKAFKVENPILHLSLLCHWSDDLGMTLSRMKRAALSPKKTSSSQETTSFEKQSREFSVRTERTLIKKKQYVKSRQCL